jgi:formate--tetrahydrofolate ligase
MAVLGMAEDLADVRRRVGRIVIGETRTGEPVTAEQLEVAGAMTAILERAIDPTILQTTEGTLAFVHTGPFANIAHGNSSIVADRVASRFADYVVTEAGFAADMGAEKFFDIKCRASGMKPDAALLVVTVKAMKAHSPAFDLKPGPLPKELFLENVEAVIAGCANLEAQIANVRAFGVPVVVAINTFPSDTAAEIEVIRERALAAGARAAEVSEVHGKGGVGGEKIARAIVAAAESGEADFRFAYDDSAPLAKKVEALATKIYGARDVVFEPAAKKALERFQAQGFGHLPVCVAKTQYSLSHDPKLKGRPTGFTFPVREARLSAGAGFVVVLAGTIMTMPGLGRTPGYKRIDLDEDGRITGLS